jgi:hypothetical protein
MNSKSITIGMKGDDFMINKHCGSLKTCKIITCLKREAV